MSAEQGNQYAKGGRAPTQAEREARAIKKLDLMDKLMMYWEWPRDELDAVADDPKTPVGDLVAIRLIRQGMYGDRDIQAIKVILDRLIGPVKQKIELSGGIFDFSNMTPEQKKELLQEIKNARRKPE